MTYTLPTTYDADGDAITVTATYLAGPLPTWITLTSGIGTTKLLNFSPLPINVGLYTLDLVVTDAEDPVPYTMTVEVL